MQWGRHTHFHGGNWCFDERSCQKRESFYTPDYMSSRWEGSSSKDWEDFSVNGLFVDVDENPLNEWHRVYLRYCSSDAFIGNREVKRPDGGTWHFRGARIVEATIQELVSAYGLGGGEDHMLLLSGCSAGAHGALATLDFVPEILEAAGVRFPVRVKKVRRCVDRSVKSRRR